ncbi:MAG: MBL fold metallo-hydrolase [Dehalococcoidales bacterium]|nr:MBL fold metallo-hydrolase [Dehalococcoidales bacterium]
MQANKYLELVASRGEGKMDRKAEGILERKKEMRGPGNFEVIKVTDTIRTIQCGVDAHFSYITWVITDEGIVVIDTGLDGAAAHANEDIARETGLPVKYIIYTHGHVDHAYGSSAFMEHKPKIIAHENMAERVKRYELVGGYIQKISAVQFNPAHLTMPPPPPPKDGEASFAGRVYVPPTETYRDEYTFTLGGKTFELFHAKGESDDCTIVWVPEEKAVFCGDLLEASFPNLGNPYKVQRYAEEWAVALERALAYDPDYAFGGDLIITSKPKIKEVFEENIELLRYLQDSVVAKLNEGKNLEQITEEVQLPAHLENSPNLSQTYSRREFAIYNIVKRYGGYFTFNPSSVLPRPKREIGAVVRNLAGSDDAIIDEADRLMNDGQLQLALETLDFILESDYENVPARRKRMEVLRKLADIDICFMSRNAYIYYMVEDEEFLNSHQ